MRKFPCFRILVLSLLATACNSQQNAGDYSAASAPRATIVSEIPQVATRAVQPKPVRPSERAPAAKATLEVTNLAQNQELTLGEPVLFRISASSEIRTVRITSNGKALGSAQARPTDLQFETSFAQSGDLDLEFTGLDTDARPLATAVYRVRVSPKPAAPAPAAGRYFNPYVLKAIKHLEENYSGLGYNRQKAFTHEIQFHNQGVIRPTGGGQTMCVAAMLEVMIYALQIYSRETGDYSPFKFLPFESWSSLRAGTFKASMWVNPKLNSAGSGDALAQFGMGERVRFRDLEPGGFININRTTRTGHAVIFIAFIDAKGRELPRYTEETAGFKYFSAQGRAIKGQGGFGYRYAFFSKNGCPAVPFKRDCNVIYSEKPGLLNVGMMFMPSQWKRMPPVPDSLGRIAVDAMGEIDMPSTLEFDGLTTDD